MAPTPTPPSPSPAIQQFLSSVLSQRGPSALPYSEDTKWLIRQHLLALVTSCPSLEPKTASFTHNDGRSINLLQADGTIPMLFQGVTYNIPVIIWLMDSYPRYPPCVYVNPTHDMIIKRPHAHVNPSGLVSVSYLQNWVYPSSNLLDLVRELSSVFGRDPPLYAQRRPNSNPNPNPNPHQSPSPSHSQSYGSNPSNLSQTSSFGSVTGPGHGRYQQPMARPYPPSPYGSGGGIPARAHQTDDAADIYRRDAINKIVEMAHGDMSQLRRSREAEMEGLFNGQGVLRRREEDVKRGLKELQDEKEGLEAQLQAVLTNSDVLEAWVRENEGKVSANLGEVDADGAFECMDSLSKQILECTAADLAIEDVVYSLDKAVQEGAVSFDQYLRNVRFLSRDQFFHRATGTKVRAVQMQAQVANMAARIQQYTL